MSEGTMRESAATGNAGHQATLLGAVAWLAMAVGSLFNWFQLSIIDLLFLLAPWVDVPLANSLIPPLDTQGMPDAQHRSIKWMVPPAALLATFSFFLPTGISAAFCAGAWLLVCALFTVSGLRRLWKYRTFSFSQFCFAMGEGYLIVGGTWLVTSRMGLQPVGFQEPIVLLTAVHFHYAGFLSAVLAGRTYEKLRETNWSRPLRAALSCVVSVRDCSVWPFSWGHNGSWRVRCSLLLGNLDWLRE
jgi:hypothetical protein